MPSALVDSKEYIGQSGCHYSIERVLQEETFPVRRVYFATQVNLMMPRFDLPAYCFLSASNQKFILKYVHEVNFKDLQDINNRLRGCANYVRLVNDIIPEKSMFVFQYFSDHLLRLIQKDLPLAATKQILKDALRGIAELHDQDIVHTGSFYPSAEQCV
jgi:serine/threonine protein kinase